MPVLPWETLFHCGRKTLALCTTPGVLSFLTFSWLLSLIVKLMPQSFYTVGECTRRYPFMNDILWSIIVINVNKYTLSKKLLTVKITLSCFLQATKSCCVHKASENRNNHPKSGWLWTLFHGGIVFFFRLLPLRVVRVDRLPTRSLVSSSVTPPLCVSSFTSSVDLLWGLPLFLHCKKRGRPHFLHCKIEMSKPSQAWLPL